MRVRKALLWLNELHVYFLSRVANEAEYDSSYWRGRFRRRGWAGGRVVTRALAWVGLMVARVTHSAGVTRASQVGEAVGVGGGASVVKVAFARIVVTVVTVAHHRTVRPPTMIYKHFSNTNITKNYPALNLAHSKVRTYLVVMASIEAKRAALTGIHFEVSPRTYLCRARVSKRQ